MLITGRPHLQGPGAQSSHSALRWEGSVGSERAGGVLRPAAPPATGRLRGDLGCEGVFDGNPVVPLQCNQRPCYLCPGPRGPPAPPDPRGGEEPRVLGASPKPEVSTVRRQGQPVFRGSADRSLILFPQCPGPPATPDAQRLCPRRPSRPGLPVSVGAGDGIGQSRRRGRRWGLDGGGGWMEVGGAGIGFGASQHLRLTSKVTAWSGGGGHTLRALRGPCPGEGRAGATEALSPITHPAPPTSRLESRRLAPGRQPPPPHCTEERDYGDLSPRVKDRVG